MSENSVHLNSAEEICRFVAETLGSLESLMPNQFRLSQSLLYRAGQPCGVYFCLHGPRALRLTAIWETEQNTIMFYGSSGKRVHRTQLSGASAIVLTTPRNSHSPGA